VEADPLVVQHSLLFSAAVAEEEEERDEECDKEECAEDTCYDSCYVHRLFNG